MIVFKRIQELLAELFDIEPEEVTPKTDLIEDLGADSLDIVEFTMMLEEEFDIKIPKKAELSQYSTVGKIVAYLETR